MQAEETWPKRQPEEGMDSEFETELKRKETERKDTAENYAPTLSELKPNKGPVNAPFGIDCDKFSSFTKLVRVTAFVQRFMRKIRKITVASGPLSSNELNDTETQWLLYLQRTKFSSLFNAIAEMKPNNLQRRLGLFMDSMGLLRYKRRLENAELSEVSSFPILLPAKDALTSLITEKTHKQIFNSDVSQTLSQTRCKFWIIHPNVSSSEMLLSLWREGQRLLNVFWKPWREEYLLSLRKRTQTHLKGGRIQSSSIPQVGDVVLGKEDVSGCLKLGKILQLFTSRDRRVRSGKVQLLSGKLLNRPLNSLYPIEVSSKIKEIEESQCSTPDDSEPTQRLAARAKLQIKRQFRD